jgi:hypothetical protein
MGVVVKAEGQRFRAVHQGGKGLENDDIGKRIRKLRGAVADGYDWQRTRQPLWHGHRLVAAKFTTKNF